MSKDTMGIDFNDSVQLIGMMDHYEDYPKPMSAENQDGETQLIYVAKNKVTAQTFQDNGWVRTNTYHRNMAVEETYSRH